MLLSILLITLPTVLIGCLPSYHMIGIAAPVLLAILRFLQGKPLPCIMRLTYLYEQGAFSTSHAILVGLLQGEPSCMLFGC
jgi:hypothetical protein